MYKLQDMTKIEEAARVGLGPVALRLLERDAIETLSNHWRFHENKSLRGIPVPSAKTLIEWTRPFKGATSLEQVAGVLQKYFSFVYKEQDKETMKNITFIAIYPFLSFLKILDGPTQTFSVLLEQPSKTTVKVTFTPDFIGRHPVWCRVEIWDALEQLNYPGTAANIHLNEFERQMNEIMTLQGWDERQHFEFLKTHRLNIEDPCRPVNRSINEFFKPSIKAFPLKTEFTRGQAFETVSRNYTETGVGFGEYCVGRVTHWIFTSKEYADNTLEELIVFSGNDQEPEVRATVVKKDAFFSNPMKVFQVSQNLDSSEAVFYPAAYIYFLGFIIDTRLAFVRSFQIEQVKEDFHEDVHSPRSHG